MVMFFFAALDQKYIFWANVIQKIKIISLSWNSVRRLIQICRKNSVVMFTLSDFGHKYTFFEKSKLSIYSEIWYLD